MRNVVEDFVCEVCGEEIKGNGTTDHCPNCLWGKHVDEADPGDRLSHCEGLMRPVAAEYKHDGFKILYKCEKCNHEFWVKAEDGSRGKADNKDILMELIKNPYLDAE